jgi:hypothetical protein
MKSTRIDLRRVLRYRDADDPCPLQRHYSHPEHDLVAHIDIVLAHERQLAVIADKENRQASHQTSKASLKGHRLMADWEPIHRASPHRHLSCVTPAGRHPKPPRCLCREEGTISALKRRPGS